MIFAVLKRNEKGLLIVHGVENRLNEPVQDQWTWEVLRTDPAPARPTMRVTWDASSKTWKSTEIEVVTEEEPVLHVPVPLAKPQGWETRQTRYRNGVWEQQRRGRWQVV